MMLSGLAEMGSLANQAVDNSAGGLVCFDVALEGTEMDLRSVLSLVVAPEQIAVQAHGAPAAGPAAPPAAPVNGAAPARTWTGGARRGERDIRRSRRVQAQQAGTRG